jgi:hypothetical protein
MLLFVLFVCFALWAGAIVFLEARELGDGNYLDVLGEIIEGE